jgi:hypothetical protein
MGETGDASTHNKNIGLGYNDSAHQPNCADERYPDATRQGACGRMFTSRFPLRDTIEA